MRARRLLAPKATGAHADTHRFLFIELETSQDADRAVRVFHDYAFDKKHRFTVVKFTDVERYASVQEDFAEPAAEEFKPRGHLKSWLADPQGRDQMVLYQGDDVRVAWHNRTGAPEVVQQRTVRPFAPSPNPLSG